MSERALGSVVVAIKAVDEASSVLDKIKTNVGLLGGAFSSMGGPLGAVGNVMTGFAAGGAVGAGLAGLGQVAGYLQDSVKAAGASEQTMNLLGQAVNNAGGSWDTVKTGVAGALTSMSSMSRFSDEDLTQSLTTLIQHSMDIEGAMKALGTAMDTAVAAGLPLEQAASAIGKAYEGQDSALTRIVPAVGDLSTTMGDGASAGDKFQAALALLNQRFGGAAASDAQTYAGTQERLNNAMGELSEKVGTILTPALTGLGNALIPVVDAFGTGVTNIQNWITEVSKTPEIQAAGETISKAFAGMQGFFTELGKAANEELGPAFKDLYDALAGPGGLMEALKPIFDALGELWGAMTGGEGSGNMMKDILGLIGDSIKIVAAAIKEIAPVIKTLAEGFKAAADLLTPILKTLRDDIGGFLEWLHTAFDNFYNWLVGASLWQDLWDAVVKVAGGVGTALAAAVKTAFDLLVGEGGVIPLAMTAVSTILSTGFSLAFTAIQGVVQLGVNALLGILQPLLDKLGEGQKTWTDLSDAVTKNTGDMKTKMDELLAKVKEVSGSMISTWKTTVDTMKSDTKTAFDQMVSDIGAAVDAIIARLRTAQSEITVHSIWPDMLGSMVDQTKDALRSITGQFDQLLSMPGDFTPEIAANLRGSRGEGAGVAGPLSFSAEIPLTSTIMIDGEQVAAIITRNSIRQQALQRTVSS